MWGNSPLQLAQMIIKDKETGKEYMIADLAGDTDHLSSQKLINLSTNETIVLPVSYTHLTLPTKA